MRPFISRKSLEQCSPRHQVFRNRTIQRRRELHFNNNHSSSQTSDDDGSDADSTISNNSNRNDNFNDNEEQIHMNVSNNSDSSHVSQVEQIGPILAQLDAQDNQSEEESENESLDKNEEIDFQTLLTDLLKDSKLNFTHMQVKAILGLLRTHNCFAHLPKDPRTILDTPTDVAPIFQVAGGEYLHLGFAKKLISILNSTPLNDIPEILDVDCNSDGANPDNARKIHMWPIQIRVANIPRCKPKMIRIFKGSKKPNNAEEYYKMFIDEVLELLENGGINFREKLIPFQFRCYIGDAPARAFTVGHREHGSSCPCSRCLVQGVSHRQGVMIYQGVNHELRTEAEYRTRNDGSHFLDDPCPIRRLNLQLTVQIIHDWMHLGCLGLMEKIFQGVVDGRFSNDAKIVDNSYINIFNKRLEKIKTFCPSDFVLLGSLLILKNTEVLKPPSSLKLFCTQVLRSSAVL